jgi:hypothetical protein
MKAGWFTQGRAGEAMGTSLGQWPALVVTNGSQTGRSVTIGVEPVVLGCSPEVDFLVEGRGVGRRHAEVFRGPRGISVRDLGSATGTRVNDELISGPTPLQPGDSLRLGDVTLQAGMVMAIPRPRQPVPPRGTNGTGVRGAGSEESVYSTGEQFRHGDVPHVELSAPSAVDEWTWARGRALALIAIGVLLAFAGFAVWMYLVFAAALAGRGTPSPFSSEFLGVKLAVLGVGMFAVGTVLAGLGQRQSKVGSTSDS